MTKSCNKSFPSLLSRSVCDLHGMYTSVRHKELSFHVNIILPDTLRILTKNGEKYFIR